MAAVSSRIRSDYGTLGERLARMNAQHAPDTTPDPRTPRQTWVLIDGHEQALIGKWRPAGDGTWEGLVARVGGIDDFWAEWIPAARLTPHPDHCQAPPLP